MISFITYQTGSFENGAAEVKRNDELELYNPELVIHVLRNIFPAIRSIKYQDNYLASRYGEKNKKYISAVTSQFSSDRPKLRNRSTKKF